MNTTTLQLYSLRLNETKTWIVAVLFVIGNITLPQLCHLIPQGGLHLLPIYFFTLIGAYKYGWRVGLLTALLSPIVNSMLFGMPATAMLPAITIKSVLLAVAAGYAAYRFNKASILLLLGVVLFYQVVGSLIEGIMVGDMYAGVQDFRMGIAGMAIQVFGGWAIINHVIRR